MSYRLDELPSSEHNRAKPLLILESKVGNNCKGSN